MQDKAKKYTLLGLVSFYKEFCETPVDPLQAAERYGFVLNPEIPAGWGNDEEGRASREKRISGFLKLILAGIQVGEVKVYGGEIKHIEDYIKNASQLSPEYWTISDAGEEKYHPPTTGGQPIQLFYEMVELEKIEVDPVPLLNWMRGREDRKNFLLDEFKIAKTPKTEELAECFWMDGKNPQAIFRELKGRGHPFIAKVIDLACPNATKTEKGAPFLPNSEPSEQRGKFADLLEAWEEQKPIKAPRKTKKKSRTKTKKVLK
ncbi:hypothetical protein LJC24_04740 [Desulfococcaceae bacterium OttesenSCG-928-F15]|nr:hypothetical protein [Desulfococcaceae bacterium OttesenSCG-928-F15]